MSMRAGSLALRLTTLGVVVGNVILSGVYATLGVGHGDIGTLSARTPTLITPAPYAFAIWGVIYAALIALAVAMLTPRGRARPAYDRLAPPLIAASLLGSAWIPAFTYEQRWLSVVLIAGMLVSACVLFQRAHAAATSKALSRWAVAPGSLLMAWLSVATMVNVAAALVGSGWDGGALGTVGWAVALLVAAGVLGAGLTLRFGEPLIAAVIAWATCAIWLADYSVAPVAAAAALTVAMMSALVMLDVAVGRQLRRHRPPPLPQ